MRLKIKKLLAVLAVATCVFSAAPIIKAHAAVENYVYLGGFPLGFDLEGEGAHVVGLAEVIGENDVFLPAKQAGIKAGDVILSLDGKKITVAADIDGALSVYEGGGMVAEVLSDGKKRICNLYPAKDISGKYKIGVLVRDYLSGLGTVTFVKESGDFYSLGHPITDEYNNLLGVSGGYCYKCVITGVEKGERGRAGELKGTILREQKLGVVLQNSSIGLIGKFSEKSVYSSRKKLAVSQPEVGNAEIYATLSGGEPSVYSISIVKVDKNDKNNKNMVIKITDERLIEIAGGIVQGMSGSPIVQNGKIVGAVTHVFLNDATRGYAIAVDKMLAVG